jgi:hypothetical protein
MREVFTSVKDILPFKTSPFPFGQQSHSCSYSDSQRPDGPSVKRALVLNVPSATSMELCVTFV